MKKRIGIALIATAIAVLAVASTPLLGTESLGVLQPIDGEGRACCNFDNECPSGQTCQTDSNCSAGAKNTCG